MYKYFFHQEQDEWKEFEEEKKDYTGLKIGNLTINSGSGEGNANTQDSTSEQQQGYDSGNDSEKKVGPWKRLDVDAAPEEQIPPPKQPEPAKPPPSKTSAQSTTTSAYVPPSLRGQQLQQQQQQSLQPSRLRSKVAPDIHNEEYFPTLAGSKSDRR